MNINLKDILNTTLYNNLLQNAELENNNTINENLENINNKMLKIQKNDIPILSSNEELKLLLNSLNLAPTKENIDLIKILVQNNLPINKDNLQDIIKSTKIFKDNSIEKALFLIENNIKPTINIGEQIDSYISKTTLIDKQIDEVFSNIKFPNNDKIINEIFKNSSFENIAKSNINTLAEFKESLLSHIFKNNNLTEFKELENIIKNTSNLTNINDKNVNIKDNTTTYKLLKNITDFTFNDELLINSEKINIFKDLPNITDKNNNTILPKTNLENLNVLIDKNTLNLIQKQIFNIIQSDHKINTKFKDLVNNIENFQKKLKFFEFKDSSNEELNKFFEDLSIISKNLKDNINNFSENNSDTIINNLDNLNKNIDFMSNLKNNMFLQIPININNFSTTAELIIFSNKKNKNNNSKNNSGSALISLNLLYLGKLEVFINKINNDISCQFRLEKDVTKNLVKENIDLLNDYLKDKNFNLKDVTFKDLDESFSLINITRKRNTSLDFKLGNFNAKA